MEDDVSTLDGVAFRARGDVMVIGYQAPARLHRSRWLYDRLDALAAEHPRGVLCLMIVLPSSDPPDTATRAENKQRLRALGPALRRMVTVPTGNPIFTSVVRAVMRSMAVIQGSSGIQIVSSTIYDGIERIRDVAGPNTPSRAVLLADVMAIYAALGEPFAGPIANSA